MLNAAKNLVREADLLAMTPDPAMAEMADLLALGVRDLVASFPLLVADPERATDRADAAVRHQRALEHVYRRAMSALLDVEEIREVAGRRSSTDAAPGWGTPSRGSPTGSGTRWSRRGERPEHVTFGTSWANHRGLPCPQRMQRHLGDAKWVQSGERGMSPIGQRPIRGRGGTGGAFGRRPAPATSGSVGSR